MRHLSLNHPVITASRAGVAIPDEKLKRAQSLRITSVYPGGLFAGCTFAVPVRAPEMVLFRGGDKISAKNGSILCFEGYVLSVAQNPAGTVGLVEVTCLGVWGYTLERVLTEKRWVDNRLTDAIWTFTTGTTGDGDQQCTVDRQARLRFTPKGVAWADGDYAALRYTQPYGETTKRLKYAYDLQEGAQAWEVSVWRSTDGSSWTKMTSLSGETYAVGTTCTIAASGTGNVDVTLGTPSRYVELRFYARAAQTPTEDGAYYGEFSGLEVYSETGNVNLYEVAVDIAAALGLSANTTWLNSGTMTFTLSPCFVANGWERYGALLQRAAGFGDASGNDAGYGVMPSTFASDSLPALFLSPRPDPGGSTFDYQVSVRTAQVPTLRFDYDSVRNFIVVTYEDAEGRTQTLHPDDETTLKDTDSMATYGKAVEVVDAGQTDSTGALSFGERILARHKGPLIAVSGPVVVREYLENANGGIVPACEVWAGKLLKITDYSGAEVQGVITRAEYDDEAKTVSLTLGPPDDLSTFIARLAGK